MHLINYTYDIDLEYLSNSFVNINNTEIHIVTLTTWMHGVM